MRTPIVTWRPTSPLIFAPGNGFFTKEELDEAVKRQENYGDFKETIERVCRKLSCSASGAGLVQAKLGFLIYQAYHKLKKERLETTPLAFAGYSFATCPLGLLAIGANLEQIVAACFARGYFQEFCCRSVACIDGPFDHLLSVLYGPNGTVFEVLATLNERYPGNFSPAIAAVGRCTVNSAVPIDALGLADIPGINLGLQQMPFHTPKIYQGAAQMWEDFVSQRLGIDLHTIPVAPLLTTVHDEYRQVEGDAARIISAIAAEIAFPVDWRRVVNNVGISPIISLTILVPDRRRPEKLVSKDTLRLLSGGAKAFSGQWETVAV